jgi:hypothetical protein
MYHQHVDRSPGLPDRFQNTGRFVAVDDVEDTGPQYHQLAGLPVTPGLSHETAVSAAARPRRGNL